MLRRLPVEEKKADKMSDTNNRHALSDRHGRNVSRVVFPNGEILISNNVQQLTFEEEYMGDHSEHWIVQSVALALDREVSRYNVRHIQSIHWGRP